MSARVLIVEDEVPLLEATTYFLQQKGYQVVGATDAEKASESYHLQPCDLIILDWNLPGAMQGIDFLRELRTGQQTVPVIMVTGKTAKEEIIQGLEAGADDYLTKPFNPEELIARMKSVMRRTQQVSPTPSKRIVYDKIVMDLDAHRVWVEQDEKQLSPKLFGMMKLLMLNPRRVFTRGQILDAVWGNENVGEKSVDVHACWLREMLGEQGKHVVTVRGFGYRFGA
ncbi:MAG TPA: response regulator transcription factor [Vampirovibrionales bacterium]